MSSAFRPRTLILFVGDLLSFVLALYGALFLRVFEAPSLELFKLHLAPFSLLFVAWVGVFFIAGLYENRSIILARRAFSTTLLIAQTFNMGLAALFFFFVPLFGIAPKTLLFIYLPVSFLLILLWRVGIFPFLRTPEGAIVVGDRPEVRELITVLKNAHRGPTTIVEVFDATTPNLTQAVLDALERHQARVIIADWSDSRVASAFPSLSQLLASGVRFYDAIALYEEVFGRVALRQINDQWIARHISRAARGLYDSLKRTMDVLIALPALLVSLIAYPFVALALKIQDGGQILIGMPRVGEGGRVFNLYKFRSMTGNDKAEYGAQGTTKLQVTPVGRMLRVSRLDEIPQLWNVIKGDLSLIGPRPEAPALVKTYEQEIPYYSMRHLIKPGLSGWAQLYHDNHPHHGSDVEATREKLSFDLYYLRHRSLVLDVTIALKTIKKLLTRSGV